MKIDSYDIQLASSHSSVSQSKVSESRRLWIGNQQGPAQGKAFPSSVVILSDQAQAMPSDNTLQQIQDAQDAVNNDPRIMLLVRMLEALTGKKIKLVNAQDLQPDEKAQHIQDNARQAAQAAQSGTRRHGWGGEYDLSISRYEAEQTSFSAQGVVKTAEGKEIRFDLQLSMQREFQSQESVSIRAGDAIRTKDPLVVNFNGTAAQLTDTKFAFDLAGDGTPDNISFVGSGSGFLALDKNGNGKIDNGTELFGAQSGNGFADLAQYDGDGNQWIDENDAVFSKLLVWAKDAGGNDSLATLAEHGIGALYLGNAATPFSVKNLSNTQQGQIRASGVYLNENGTAGTLQQVDLAV